MPNLGVQCTVHQAVATAVEARAVSYAVSPNNEWNDFFWEEVCLIPW